MAFRQARRLQDRVQLDQPVRIRRYTIRSHITGGFDGLPTFDGEVWCLREDTRQSREIGSDATTLYFPRGIVIRWAADLESLEEQRVTLAFPESSSREDRVSRVEMIGRRRYLRLEVEA